MFMMPVLTIPDEAAHFWVSYGMFSKNEQMPKDLLVSAEDSAHYVKDGTYIHNVFGKKVDLEGDTIQFNFARTININSSNDSRIVSSLDIAHLPQAAGILVGRLVYPSIGVMSTIGRIFNLTLYLAVIYFIINRVRYGKIAITFLALFPMMIHQAASLSHDVVNIVVIFAWVALMINLFAQEQPITKKQLAAGLVLALLLMVTKASNVLFLGFVLFLPWRLYRNTSIYVFLRENLRIHKPNKKTVVVLFVTLGVFVLAAGLLIGHQYLVSHGIGVFKFLKVFFNTFFRTDINTQLDPIVTTGIVGHFGWLWYKLPEWLVITHLSIFGLILLGDKAPVVSRKFAIMSGIILVLSILAITVGMYFQWTILPQIAGTGAEFIQGVQGRYFTLLLILLVPVFAYIQQFVSVKIERKLLCTIAAVVSSFSLIVYLVLTYAFFH